MPLTGSKRRRGGGDPRGPRVLAYSHDGYGLGHLRRNLRLVSGIRRARPDVEAMLVTGATAAERLVRGPGLTCVPLPAVVKVANGRYLPAEGNRKLHDVMSDRAQVIAAAVRDFQPDLLLVDRYPRGLREELVPALRVHAARRPGAPAVLGLRDILDSPGVIRAEWEAEDYSEAILETYATVLCYGDQAVYDPIREYRLPRAVADRVRFTGYLVDGVEAGEAAAVRRRHRSPGGRLAVCTLGGGRDAAHIAHSFIGAIDRLADAGWNGLLIAGPFMTEEDFTGLLASAGDAGVTVIRMVDDLPSYLAAADAAVCMGGYNTTCELLALAVPAVIIPRVRPRQEQQMRAERLAARGLVSCLHPGELSADALADRIWCAAAGSRAEISERLDSIARRGVQTAADEIAALLPAARPRPAPSRLLAEPTPPIRGLRSAGRLPRRAAEVLLLRHAQTGWNDLQRRQGCSDQPLTDAGRRAATEWAARTPSRFAAVCFSDLQRSRETAAIIAAGLGVDDRREINGLREQDQGAWTGLTKQQIERLWPERLRERPRRPVGGEPPEELLERVRAALASIAASHPGARVLAITHSEVIRTLELAMSLAAPPVPQLEGRWLRVQAPREVALEPAGAWLTAGELTAGRATAHGTPRAA